MSPFSRDWSGGRRRAADRTHVPNAAVQAKDFPIHKGRKRQLVKKLARKRNRDIRSAGERKQTAVGSCHGGAEGCASHLIERKPDLLVVREKTLAALVAQAKRSIDIGVLMVS